MTILGPWYGPRLLLFYSYCQKLEFLECSSILWVHTSLLKVPYTVIYTSRVTRKGPYLLVKMEPNGLVDLKGLSTDTDPTLSLPH